MRTLIWISGTHTKAEHNKCFTVMKALVRCPQSMRNQGIIVTRGLENGWLSMSGVWDLASLTESMINIVQLETLSKNKQVESDWGRCQYWPSPIHEYLCVLAYTHIRTNMKTNISHTLTHTHQNQIIEIKLSWHRYKHTCKTQIYFIAK